MSLGIRFEFSEAKARPSVFQFLSLLPSDLDVELIPCLPAFLHASHYDKNGLNL